MAGFDADYFHDEQAAYAFIEARVWVHGRRCPHCGFIGRSGPLSGQSTRVGTYKCYACRKPFTVKIGTIFEGSHIPLHIWLQAIFLLSSAQEPIGANQLHRTLGISVKSAAFLLERIGDGSGVAFLSLGIGAPSRGEVPQQRSPGDVSGRIHWRHTASRIRLSHSWQGPGQIRQGLAISRTAMPRVRFVHPMALGRSAAEMVQPAEPSRSVPEPSPTLAYPAARNAAPAAPAVVAKPIQITPRPARPRTMPVRPRSARGLLHSDMYLPGGIPIAPPPDDISAGDPPDNGNIAYQVEAEILPLLTVHGRLALAPPVPETLARGELESATGRLLPCDVAAEILERPVQAPSYTAEAADLSDLAVTPDIWRRSPAEAPAIIPSPVVYFPYPDQPGSFAAARPCAAGDPPAPVPEIRAVAAASIPAPTLPMPVATVTERPWQPMAFDRPVADAVSTATLVTAPPVPTIAPELLGPGIIPAPGIGDVVAAPVGHMPAVPEHAVWSASITAIPEIEPLALVYAQTPLAADGNAKETLAADAAPVALHRDHATATCDTDFALGPAIPAQWLMMVEQAPWQQIQNDLPVLLQDAPADTSPQLVQMPVTIFAWQRPGTTTPAATIDIAYHANDNRGRRVSGRPPSPPQGFWARARQRLVRGRGSEPVRQIETPPPVQDDQAIAIAARATSHEFGVIPAPAPFAALPAVLFRFAELSAAVGVMEKTATGTTAAIMPVPPVQDDGPVLHFPKRLTEPVEDWTAFTPAATWRPDGEFPAFSIDAAPGVGARPMPQPVALEVFDFRPPAAQDDEYALAPALHGGEVLRREVLQETSPGDDAGAEDEELPAYLVPPLPFSAEDAAAPSASRLNAPVAADIVLGAENTRAAPEPIDSTATQLSAESVAPAALDATPAASQDDSRALLTAPVPVAAESFDAGNAVNLTAPPAGFAPAATETASPIPVTVAPPASSDQVIAAPKPVEHGGQPSAAAPPIPPVADLTSGPAMAKLDSPEPVAIPPVAALVAPILPAGELPGIAEAPVAGLPAGAAVPAAIASAIAQRPALQRKVSRMRQAAIAAGVLLLAIIAVTAQQLFNWMQSGNSGQAARNRVAPNGGGAQPNAPAGPPVPAPALQGPGGNVAIPAAPTTPGTGSNGAPPAGGGPGTSSPGGGVAPPQTPPPAAPASRAERRQQGASAAPRMPPISPEQGALPRPQPAATGPQIAQAPNALSPMPEPNPPIPAPMQAPVMQIAPATVPMPQSPQPLAPQQQTQAPAGMIAGPEQPPFPVRAHLGYDNAGLPVLGRDEWTAGLDIVSNDLYGGALSYQYTSDLPPWRTLNGTPAAYAMHSATVVAPLPWRDSLTAFGFYATGVPGFGPDAGARGTTWQASGRYVLSLPVTARFNQQLRAGFDFKSSNNNVLFGGLRVFAVTSEVDQFSADYSFSLRDSIGETSADGTVVASPGGLSSGNNNTNFNQQQPFAGARYTYARLDATRIMELPQDAEWVKNLGWFGGASSRTHVVGQWASTILLPTEQLGIGGLDTVPGYNERMANGSVGLFVNEELLTPAFGILRHFLPNDPGDLAQLSGFFAYGSVRNQKWQAGTENDHDLMSAGLGASYNLGPYVNFHFVYGWQLRAASGVPAAVAPEGGQLGEFTLRLSYP